MPGTSTGNAIPAVGARRERSADTGGGWRPGPPRSSRDEHVQVVPATTDETCDPTCRNKVSYTPSRPSYPPRIGTWNQTGVAEGSGTPRPVRMPNLGWSTLRAEASDPEPGRLDGGENRPEKPRQAVPAPGNQRCYERCREQGARISPTHPHRGTIHGGSRAPRTNADLRQRRKSRLEEWIPPARAHGHHVLLRTRDQWPPRDGVLSLHPREDHRYYGGRSTYA